MDNLEQRARDVQVQANAALAQAHPREDLHSVIADIVEGWEYVEMSSFGGKREIMITTQARR